MSEQEEKPLYFIGVNVNTTEVTAIAVSGVGDIAFESRSKVDEAKGPMVKGQLEQPCENWWNATCFALGHLVTQIRNSKIAPEQLRGIAVSGEPNHIAILSRSGASLYPAILSNDQRAIEQTQRLNIIGQEYCKKVGTIFRPEDALPKIVWVKENLPSVYENAVFVHQSDYVSGLLRGQINMTDSSVAVSTGHDSVDDCWPDWLDYDMHLSIRERLPQLGELGQVIGKVSPAAAKSTGLPVGLPVILGCSSQTASFIASGARQQGDFFTSFDETMRVDGILQNRFQYPHTIMKLNRLPKREWFFSTRTNTGTEWVSVWFKDQLAEEYIEKANAVLPSQYLAYPNVRSGEIFPFNTNSAEGFISPATDNRLVQFAACVQGTAMIERLMYQTIDKLSDNSNLGQVYTTGHWCHSDIWMQCRADVTERVLHRLAKSQGPAFGAAMVAAMGTTYGTIQNASDAMVGIEKSFYPNPDRMSAYKDVYATFQRTMQEQGYLD